MSEQSRMDDGYVVINELLFKQKAIYYETVPFEFLQQKCWS